MKEKVLVVSGSYPPDVCGVGDYVYCLMTASNAENWEVFVKKDWSIKNLRKYINEIESISPDKLIIQYPTQGYGWSLTPFLLMIHFSFRMGKKCIVTYHEFSNQSFKAKLCENIALYGVKNLVVTNEYEKEAVRYYHKHLQINVNKIFSNIPKVQMINSWNQRKIDYCYFGQIRPNKGIEEYIHVVKDSSKRKLLIGTIPKGFEDYGKRIVQLAQSAGIDINNNATLDEVASTLNNCKLVILPFPDGLSERRGSFLAAALNGCLICATSGRYTSENLKKCISIDYIQDIGIIDKFIDSLNSNEWHRLYEINKEYLKKSVPMSWEEVVSIYNSL